MRRKLTWVVLLSAAIMVTALFHASPAWATSANGVHKYAPCPRPIRPVLTALFCLTHRSGCRGSGRRDCQTGLS